MKSLHLCNLANVAYGYCKILHDGGHPVDLRCHDLKHVMSQPEWDDLELNADAFPEENDFFKGRVDLGDYRRPDWFLADDIVAAQPVAVRLARRVLPQPVKNVIKPFYYGLRRLRERVSSRNGARAAGETLRRRCAQLAEESARYGDEWAVPAKFVRTFLPHASWLDRHVGDHDVIFAYVHSPIYAMIHNRLPYVAVEIGGLRDIPFDGTETGRIVALAYRKANHVIITNPDNNRAAERLGITSYSFCHHPLNETIYTPDKTDSPLRKELLARHDAEIILFASARQNWQVKGNDKFLRAFAELLRRGVKAVLVVPGWGQEVDRSRRLCDDLGIGRDVVWTKPMSEPSLAEYYRAADLVLDQFQLGVFGLITPKAMCCGKCVLTSYDPALHEWCFDEHPPIVACRTEKEIFEAMLSLGRSADARRRIGAQARRWALEHCSRKSIEKTLTEAMRAAVQNAVEAR